MTYEVLARKWRPQSFSAVIGQEHITSTLVNAVGSGRLAHAYLFSGPRGVGKTSVARILAKAMNCTSGSENVPCNMCSSCKEITAGLSVDVQEIDGASNRGIDEIRDLRDGIKYMPSSSTYRIYIIDEVHMLTLPAFNALLKTLEEPPPHVKFIFATTEPQKVPITILSRCQRFDFKRIPRTLMTAHLRAVADQERIEISDSALSIIAEESEGSMRDAESLLDQIVSSVGAKVEDARLHDILGVVDRNVIYGAAGAVLESSTVQCLGLIEDIYVRGYDIKDFYRCLMDHFRSLLVCRIAPEAVSNDMPAEQRESLFRQASSASPNKLQVLLDFLIAREEALRYTSLPRVILEATMIRMCRIDDYLSLEEVLEKLDAWSRGEEGRRPPAPPLPPAEPRSFDSPVQGDGPGWEEFLAFLRTRHKGMYNILKDWSVSAFSGDRLEIVRGGLSFSASYFDDSGNMAQLENLCREFFDRPVSVRIISGNGPSAISRVSEDAGPRSIPGGSGKPDASPYGESVENVLRIFQGQVCADTRSENLPETFCDSDFEALDKEED
jgi:DNA polymerase III subunit gamma/tau